MMDDGGPTFVPPYSVVLKISASLSNTFYSLPICSCYFKNKFLRFTSQKLVISERNKPVIHVFYRTRCRPISGISMFP